LPLSVRGKVYFKGILTGGVEELKKESPDYDYSLGSLADNRKDWDGAIRYYNRALVADPQYTKAYLGLGGDYHEEGDYESEVMRTLLNFKEHRTVVCHVVYQRRASRSVGAATSNRYNDSESGILVISAAAASATNVQEW